MPDARTVQLGDNRIDLDGGRLVRGEVDSFIQPKPLALLRRLLEAPGRFVSKEELRESVWPGVTVTDAALTSALRDLRRALGDDGVNPRLIETRRRRGVRLMESIPEPRPPDPPEAGAGLVGRTGLLRALGAQLAVAKEGESQVVVLRGEPGVGKTRLALALASVARGEGFGVHAGHALEEEGAPAFRPWIQILRDVLGDRTPQALDPSLVGRSAEALTALIGAGAPDTPVPRERDDDGRFVLLEAACRALRAAAREQPRLLILEDLHRADPASVALLRMLTLEISDVPLMLLGTVRDRLAEPQDDFARMLDELPSAITRIAVPGLDLEEVEDLMARTAGEPPHPDLPAAILARTGGNPLFVQEITRALASEGGVLSPSAIEKALHSAPEGVRQVIRRRIAGLDEDVRDLLERAAVIGRTFDWPLVEAAWSDRADALDAALTEACDAGVVSEVSRRDEEFGFVHDLFREALYDGIPGPRRAELHAEVARALERVGDVGRVGWLAAMAHHFGEAASGSESEDAVHWGTKAAEQALELTAYEDATSNARRALRATVGSRERAEPSRTRAALFTLLGRARWSAGEPGEARQAFRYAIQEAEATEASDLFARAALGFVGRTDATPGVNQEGVGLLFRALAMLPQGDGALRAEVLARLGTESYYGPDPGRSQTLTAEAVAMAERLGEEALLAYALSAQCYAALRPEVVPEFRLRLADRVVALAERSDAPNDLAIGLQERIQSLLELGDGLGVAKAADAYGRLARELGQPFLRWLHGLYQGMQALLAGRIAEAERLAHGAFSRGQRMQTPNALGAFAAQLFGIRAEQGRLGELEASLTSLAREQPELAVFRVAAASVAAVCGRHDVARRELATLLEVDLDRLPRDQHWLPILTFLADTCVSVEDVELMRPVRALLAPHAGQVIVTGHGAGVLGAGAHHLGRLDARLGDLERASAAFEAAAALHERLHSPLWVAHTRREHARALRDGGGDRARADELARAAAEAYERFELPHRLAQAHDLLEP